MLDDVERNVDRTDSKLNSAMRKLRKFVRDTEGTASSFLDITFALTRLLRRDQVRVVHHNFDNRACHLICGGHIGLIAEDTSPLDFR